MKKILQLVTAGILLSQYSYGQVLYSETFSGLTLATGTSFVPSNMITINADGLAGNTNANNAPFNAAPYASTAWVARAIGNDTAAESTSWTTTAGATVDRWLITPAITGINATTIIAWTALASDATYPDGYEVWVSAAAGAASSPVAADFTAIATNRVFNITSEGTGAFVNHSVSLSAFAGMTVRVGIRNHSTDMFHLYFDDILVINPVAKEVSALSIVMNKYALAGNSSLATVINSHGGPIVTSAIVNYNVDGGTATTQTFTPNIGYGASYTANFTTPANLTAGVHNIKSWISDVNGTGLDATTADDTAYWQISVLPGAAPVHNVLIEEYTGAWCGYCPRGGVALTQITASDPQVFGAAIHDNDAMSTTEGNVVDAIYPTGYPTGTIDRAYFSGDGAYALDNSVWATDATTREAQVVPATVSLSAVSYNSSTRTITATVNATFVGAVRGSYALNCYVLENRVYGPLTDITDNGWNNHSYYYADNTSPFYNVGLTTGAWSTSVAGLTPIDYQHNHVVDKMIGGAWGDNTVVPTSLVPAGTVYSKTFTYVLPASNPGGAHRFNPDNIHILGIVQEYSTPTSLANSYILNVAEAKLTTNPESGASMLGIQTYEPTSFGTVSVFPNPASTSTNVGIELKVDSKVSISVYNTLGQAVVNEDYVSLSAGNHIYTLNTENLANGIYSIVVNTSNGSVTKKVVINK